MVTTSKTVFDTVATSMAHGPLNDYDKIRWFQIESTLAPLKLLGVSLVSNSIHQTSDPGRILYIILEAPVSSATVVSIPINVHHSRLGPDGRGRPGVFQSAAAGKYRPTSVFSSPDTALNSSSITVISPSASITSQSNVLSFNCHQKIVVYYQNVGDININVDDIRLAVSDQCYNIVVLTETWLDSRTLSHQMFGKDYEVFRCDRNADNSRKARGGGVLVAVNSRLEARAVDNQKWICLEQVWTAITLGDPTDEVILMGDFNLPRISWKKSCNGFLYPDLAHSTIPPNASFLLDNYSLATLSQINYVTNQNDRSLDLCFVSAQDTAPFLCRAPAPLVKHTPHHPPLLVTVALTFSNVLAYVIDRYVPKKKCHHASRKPWQTCVLRRLKSMKRAALRNFTTHRTQILQYQYARINHEYKRVAKQSFLHYQRRVQRKLISHPKQFWKFVNEQRHSAGLPSSMAFNGIVASTQRDICNLFSDKFASVFTDESLSDEHIRHAAGYVPLSNQTLSRVDISLEMISRSFSKKLKASFNPGPDGIPSAFLKTHMNDLLTPLLQIFQLSVSTGVFPTCWKLSHMFPVHKKGNRRDVNNYRGITSLCALAKLFELVIMEPLNALSKPYISTDQHGFTTGRSTTTNLLCLTSYITNSMLQYAQTDAIYTDLTAAFDKLNHRIAVAKLDRLGINGNLLQWFQSYLTGRRLAVVIGDCQSSLFAATSGIPQGSHLG
ncbi:uncharacterized protein LOC129782425 [Toxorhynchites rutilus septentrionalis]|uniref:uncharacterized protein LOC129782425 n=1 Tax=Toxorhynchites rutilus septentrionalis TaxID=329112 RepID=UPI0024783DF7|nr:uncharacterized protein LOC129782425 [Toxorhynchites rutilus septentrionalis]